MCFVTIKDQNEINSSSTLTLFPIHFSRFIRTSLDVKMSLMLLIQQLLAKCSFLIVFSLKEDNFCKFFVSEMNFNKVVVIFLLLYGVFGDNVTNQKEEIVIGFLAEYARMRVSFWFYLLLQSFFLIFITEAMVIMYW